MICGEEDDRIARIADANAFYASCKHGQGFDKKGFKILQYWKSKHIMTRDSFPESATLVVAVLVFIKNKNRKSKHSIKTMVTILLTIMIATTAV